MLVPLAALTTSPARAAYMPFDTTSSCTAPVMRFSPNACASVTRLKKPAACNASNSCSSVRFPRCTMRSGVWPFSRSSPIKRLRWAGSWESTRYSCACACENAAPARALTVTTCLVRPRSLAASPAPTLPSSSRISQFSSPSDVASMPSERRGPVFHRTSWNH